MIDNLIIPEFLVSIHCMTYNHASFIEDTMNGFCIQQTNFPYIAIICDDASTDGEQDVIKSYLDKHFVDNTSSEYWSWEDEEAFFFYARHQQNIQCYFLVILLKTNYYSQGKDKKHLWEEWERKVKYVALCEGDDYWTKSNKLQLQVDELDKHTDCSFCVTDYDEYNEYFKEFHTHQLEINRNIQGGLIFLSINDCLHRGFFTKTLTAVYRKDALMQSNYYLYRAQYDMPMFYALLTQGNCIFVNEVMGVYRLSDAGITSPIHRRMFIDFYLPKLFSIIEIEKTREAQQFVYIFMVRYIIYVLATRQYGIPISCITHFSLILNVKLFFYELPKQVCTIIRGKIK